MQLKICLSIAILFVASISIADDKSTKASTTRLAKAKSVLSSEDFQVQTLTVADDSSATAAEEGDVKLVQYSRAVSGQQRASYGASRQSQSVLGRLVELERRKNAWLRRTFLGRE